MFSDDCNNYELILTTSLDAFIKEYNEFMNLKPTTDENKIRITKKIKIIDILIPDINKKFDTYLNSMKMCKKNHSLDFKDTEFKKQKFQSLHERYINQQKKIYSEGFEPMTEEEKKTKEKFETISKIKQTNNYNSKNSYYNNSNYDPLNEEEELKIQQNNIIQVQKFLDKPDTLSKIQKEEMTKIIQIKNELQDLLNQIGKELNKQDNQLLEIEDNIEDSVQKMEKGNNELKIAANEAIKSRATKYKLILGGSLAIIGSLIPGLNIIGGVIGGISGFSIGKGIEKLDKKYIHKVNKI